jgi:transcriptional regulator
VADRTDLLQGTLDLLILKTLSLEAMHGWGITLRLEQMSRQALLINQGSLYPALERLKRQGYISSTWRTTENNRQARYYDLTAAGRKELSNQRAAWQRASAVVNSILDWAGAVP